LIYKELQKSTFYTGKNVFFPCFPFETKVEIFHPKKRKEKKSIAELMGCIHMPE